MPTPQDHLLGRIALSSGMITQEQLADCLSLQDRGQSARPLGEILLDKGYINPAQRDRLLALQKKHQAAKADSSPRVEGRDESMFGRLILRKGFVTADQLNECLRHQERELERGRSKNLGQVMVEKGYLSRDQVKEVLADQQKIIVICNNCGTRFNASAGAKLPKCPSCGGVLAAPPWSVSLPVVDSIRENGETVGLIGKVVGGFKLLEFVGRSAKGTLYKAQHPTLDRPMAAKVIPITPDNREVLVRYMQTAKALATLSHPNVLRVHAAGMDANFCYVITDFIHGRPLNVFLDRGSGVPPVDALGYVRSIARGVAAAHARKVLHRDLTADNVLLSVGRELFVKDFQFARRVEVMEEGEKRRVVYGSPSYLAPELWQGDAGDARADLYAMGVILYALIAGRRPFDALRVTDLMRQHLQTPPAPLRVADPMTESLGAIVEKLLAKDPRNRYQSADDLIRDLTRVEQGEAPEALKDFGVSAAPVAVRRSATSSALPTDAEFVCANCGSVQKKGVRRCSRCHVEICRNCQRQVASVNGLCAECLSTGNIQAPPIPVQAPPHRRGVPPSPAAKRADAARRMNNRRIRGS
jgi:ribosomal protein L37AE/L43A